MGKATEINVNFEMSRSTLISFFFDKDSDSSFDFE
jgi:hypothetical protein